MEFLNWLFGTEGWWSGFFWGAFGVIVWYEPVKKRLAIWKDHKARPYAWECPDCAKIENFYRISGNEIAALDHLINQHKREMHCGEMEA